MDGSMDGRHVVDVNAWLTLERRFWLFRLSLFHLSSSSSSDYGDYCTTTLPSLFILPLAQRDTDTDQVFASTVNQYVLRTHLLSWTHDLLNHLYLFLDPSHNPKSCKSKSHSKRRLPRNRQHSPSHEIKQNSPQPTDSAVYLTQKQWNSSSPLAYLRNYEGNARNYGNYVPNSGNTDNTICARNSGRLYEAVTQYRFYEVYRRLLLIRMPLKQADVDILWQEGSRGDTSLIAAARNGRLDLVRLLHQFRSPRNNKNNGNNGTNTNKNGNDPMVDKPNYYGTNALMVAVQGGWYMVVKYLVEKMDARVMGVDEEGWTTLMTAGAHGHWQILEYLYFKWETLIGRYAHSGAANDIAGAKNNAGETVVMIAAQNGHLTVLTFLEKEGMSCGDMMKPRDLMGRNTLDIALHHGRLQVVTFFISIGARTLRLFLTRGHDAIGRRHPFSSELSPMGLRFQPHWTNQNRAKPKRYPSRCIGTRETEGLYMRVCYVNGSQAFEVFEAACLGSVECAWDRASCLFEGEGGEGRGGTEDEESMPAVSIWRAKKGYKEEANKSHAFSMVALEGKNKDQIPPTPIGCHYFIGWEEYYCEQEREQKTGIDRHVAYEENPNGDVVYRHCTVNDKDKGRGTMTTAVKKTTTADQLGWSDEDKEEEGCTERILVFTRLPTRRKYSLKVTIVEDRTISRLSTLSTLPRKEKRLPCPFKLNGPNGSSCPFIHTSLFATQQLHVTPAKANAAIQEGIQRLQHTLDTQRSKYEHIATGEIQAEGALTETQLESAMKRTAKAQSIMESGDRQADRGQLEAALRMYQDAMLFVPIQSSYYLEEKVVLMDAKGKVLDTRAKLSKRVAEFRQRSQGIHLTEARRYGAKARLLIQEGRQRTQQERARIHTLLAKSLYLDWSGGMDQRHRKEYNQLLIAKSNEEMSTDRSKKKTEEEEEGEEKQMRRYCIGLGFHETNPLEPQSVRSVKRLPSGARPRSGGRAWDHAHHHHEILGATMHMEIDDDSLSAYRACACVMF